MHNEPLSEPVTFRPTEPQERQIKQVKRKMKLRNRSEATREAVAVGLPILLKQLGIETSK